MHMIEIPETFNSFPDSSRRESRESRPQPKESLSIPFRIPDGMQGGQAIRGCSI